MRNQIHVVSIEIVLELICLLRVSVQVIHIYLYTYFEI